MCSPQGHVCVIIITRQPINIIHHSSISHFMRSHSTIIFVIIIISLGPINYFILLQSAFASEINTVVNIGILYL